MNDPRLDKMAEILVNYSVNLKPGEKVLIEVIDSGIPLASAIIREVYRIGGIPFVLTRNKQLDRQLMLGAIRAQLESLAQFELIQMKSMDAYLGVRGDENANETADVPTGQQQLYQKIYGCPVRDYRVNQTKWCIMRYPTSSMAQSASMSTEAFEDFYFDACTLNYAEMLKAMEPLKNLLEETDLVRLTGRDTDLTFSIKGLPAVPCAGEMNIPDGEIYTAPVKESVNGIITYNTPTVYQGVSFENVKLYFKNGKIIKVEGSDSERLNQVFDTDAGARYVGEFSLGINPRILKPIKDTLFDEKISGSIHFTPGNSYQDADNGNKSAVHWDLVLIQRPEYGGGEIWFDDKLIRKDGRFVIKELEPLNPENLI